MAYAVVGGMIIAMAFLSFTGSRVEARRAAVLAMTGEANIEILKMAEADQKNHKKSSVSTPEDAANRVRLKGLYKKGLLRNGQDYYLASTIMRRGTTPEDMLLAHDLAAAALMLGERSAGWVLAASEDRYLVMTGKPQRFGTQFENGKRKPVDDPISDAHRQVLGVAPLVASNRISDEYATCLVKVPNATAVPARMAAMATAE